ncbi:DNA recombination protein RmuC [Niveibacterium sp. SC-1]|uniref:DNA recombination protein RmuC n=1 Tax=Niveibacterium sp. SC-1 TaxID=3135646 RepID=UPI00311DAF8B
MNAESYFLFVLGGLIGALVGWACIRKTSSAAHARLALELATANQSEAFLREELTRDRLALTEASTRCQRLNDALDVERTERARLQVHAGRIPELEVGLAQLHQTSLERDERLISLSNAEGQQTQAIADLRCRLEESSGQLKQLREALEQERTSARRQGEQLAEAASKGQSLSEMLEASRQQVAERTAQREAADHLCLRHATRLAELEAELNAERQQSAEKLALMQEAREALSNQFKALASEILEEKAKRFAEQNQTNLGQLLEPLKRRLQEFQGKVEEVYVNEGKDRSALGEQVKQLMALNQVMSDEARNLTRALKGSGKTQGSWGELVLERVLEASGLRKGEEYETQVSHPREDGGRSQPDVVIRLPESRSLVVDAKVSLLAYERFASAEDDVARAAALRQHLDSVRTHIKGLSEKRYQDLYGLRSLDFVLMFVPVEPAFMLAVTEDSDLFMDAWQKNVLLVSPSTLLFVVRTVAHLWRQEAQNRNAQEIAKRGAELYDKLVGFVTDMESLGARLQQAQDAYGAARSKLTTGRGNVIRQAEMLKGLGIKPVKAMPEQIKVLSLSDDAGMGGASVLERTPTETQPSASAAPA